jgi:hypothetical protein
MAGSAYVAIDSTAGATAPKTHIGLLSVTNARAKVRGFHLGNTAATAAQGVRWVLNAVTTAGTATTITAANTKLDPDAPSPRTVATSTYTAEPSAGVTIGDFGFDIVGTFIYWYPPGVEPFATNASRLALTKTVGADSSTWAGSLYWEE